MCTTMKPHSLRCKNREKFVRVKSEKVFYPGSIRTLSLFRQKNTLVFFFFFRKVAVKKQTKKEVLDIHNAKHQFAHLKSL